MILNEREINRATVFTNAVCASPHLFWKFLEIMRDYDVTSPLDEALMWLEWSWGLEHSIRAVADFLISIGGPSLELGYCFYQELRCRFDGKDVTIP